MSSGVLARQMAGLDQQGAAILSVLVKRTYAILPDGRCAPAEEQLPLVEEPQLDGERMVHDTDLLPFKLGTDVVVKGHAYAPASVSWFDARVHVGKTVKVIRVFGDRRALMLRNGRVVFSESECLDRVPIRYDFAYGGRDAVAEAALPPLTGHLRELFPSHIRPEDLSPFIYPRNACGAGYVMELTEDRLDLLRLPNLEDPYDPLTPERLPVGTPGRWPLMPMPQATDWVHWGWFPRVAYFGGVPMHEMGDLLVAEAERGYAPADVLVDRPIWEKFDLRCASGASLGLQVPYLRPEAVIGLVHIQPSRTKFALHLPGEFPRIWTDGREGRLNETEPVIHNVVIEPDEGRVSILWRGSAPARRGYSLDELAAMPFRVAWS